MVWTSPEARACSHDLAKDSFQPSIMVLTAVTR